jgi:hypothetical protein
MGKAKHNSFAQKIVDVHTERGGDVDIDETVRFLKCGKCKELAYWNLECPSCSQVLQCTACG